MKGFSVLCGIGILGVTMLLGDYEKVETMHVRDLWSYTEYVGKTTKEAAVPENCIAYTGTHPMLAYLDGRLFEKKATGSFRLTDDYSIEELYMYSVELTYEEAYEELTKKYGEPFEKGQNPDVEVSGHTVLWSKFNTGTYIVTLSTASKHDYISIYVQKEKTACIHTKYNTMKQTAWA